MNSELFWMIVGSRVQSHFLYKNILTKEEFKEICKKVRKENREYNTEEL